MRYRNRVNGVVVSVSDDRTMGAGWEPLESASGSECPECDFVAKSPAGLAAHARKHDE